MENKITISGLSAMIALSTGRPGDLCELFLKEFFRIVSEELAKGESVRVKGLGTFKITDIEPRKSVDVTSGEEIEIPAHKRVIFVASKELASQVNAPFEAFEAVEVSDALPTDMLMSDTDVLMNELADNNEEDSCEPYDTAISNDSNGPIKANNPDDVKNNNTAQDDGQDDNCQQVVAFASESNISGKRENEEEEPSASESLSICSEETGKYEINDSVADDINNSSSATEETTDGGLSSDVNELQIDSAPSSYDEENEYVEEEEEEKKGRFGRGFIIGFLSATALVALFALLMVAFEIKIIPETILSRIYSNNEKASATTEETIKPGDVTSKDEGITSLSGDSVAGTISPVSSEPIDNEEDDAVPTQQSDSPVYDTVSTTRFLTTMAQEHYGNYNLWPIIYKENQEILGNPDRITPGTKVVIPPLSKYKIDPTNPGDVKRMKQEGTAIYDKFKKK